MFKDGMIFYYLTKSPKRITVYIALNGEILNVSAYVASAIGLGMDLDTQSIRTSSPISYQEITSKLERKFKVQLETRQL